MIAGGSEGSGERIRGCYWIGWNMVRQRKATNSATPGSRNFAILSCA
jgi:hypothetical protein